MLSAFILSISFLRLVRRRNSGWVVLLQNRLR